MPKNNEHDFFLLHKHYKIILVKQVKKNQGIQMFLYVGIFLLLFFVSQKYRLSLCKASLTYRTGIVTPLNPLPITPDHDPSQQIYKSSTQPIESLSNGGGCDTLVCWEPGG